MPFTMPKRHFELRIDFASILQNERDFYTGKPRLTIMVITHMDFYSVIGFHEA